MNKVEFIRKHRQTIIAVLALTAIGVHLILRFALKTMAPFHGLVAHEWPLIVALALGGIPLVFELLLKLLRREFGSDLLAGISIVTSVFLNEYLAGTLVVLMLSGGEAGSLCRAQRFVGFASAGQAHAFRGTSQAQR
jgi:cation transport ATPase